MKNDRAVIRRFVTLCGCSRDEPVMLSEIHGHERWLVPLRPSGFGVVDDDPHGEGFATRAFIFKHERPEGVFVFVEHQP